MAKKSIESQMKAAQKKMKAAIKGEIPKKKVEPCKRKNVKEQYKEIKESLNPVVPDSVFATNYEELLKQQLFREESSRKREIEDNEESNYYDDVVNKTPETRERSGLWDFLIDDTVEYFDPSMSYELTGYRPINEEDGLDFDPAPFCETGRIYTETGSYTEYPIGTKPYADFWTEQLKRSSEGYTIGKYRVTGDHYFFLNFYRMSIINDSYKAAVGDDESFPKFVIEQYKWFHYIEICEYLKKDIVGLKARGVGFSEVAASLGVRPFITTRNYRTLYVASTEAYVDGVLDKCWRQLNWLNNNTNGGMKRARQKIDNIKQKRASRLDKEGNEYGRRSEIEGIVADNPRKVRGDRCHRLMYEESGSNPWLRTEWTQGEALVTVAGARKGIRCAWGCVCAGSKVFKSNGEQCNIEELKQSDGILGFKDNKANIEEISYMQGEAYKPCVRITTDYGILECSEDHPIYTRLYTNKRNGTKRYKEYYYKFVDAINIKKYRTSNAIALCDKIDIWGEEFLFDPYLVGLLIGNGTYEVNKTPMLLNSDPIINKYISNNYITRIEKSYTAKGCKYYIENSILNIYQHLCDIGIYGQTQDNKRMPDNYLNLSKGHITNLLAGIFDTVCKISRCRAEISLTHSSLDLLKQVKFILRKLGVFGRISTIKSKVSHNSQDINKSYILFIRDIQSIYNFKQAVPIKVDYKINSLDKIVCKINKGSFSNGIRNAHVKSVEQIGVNRIYNLTANDSHTYIANDIITHNTGGDSDSKALQGLSEMFNNPKSYNVLPYKNRYSDDGEVQYTGFFLPAYSMMLKSGYVDNRGVTFLKKSRDYYEEARKNKSGQALLEYCAEYCFTPGEALLRQGDGIFDPILIADRLTQLRIQKIGITPQRVDLLWDCPNSDSNPRNKVKVVPNSQGKIYIYEPPLNDGDGNLYKNLYIAGIDSIDQGTADSSTNTDVSDFCIVIKKRILGSSPSNYVAIYKDRPRDIVTAYEYAMRLCVYYNCRAMLEHTKISIIMYFRSKKKENLFMTRPKSTMPDIRKGNSAMIGYPATETYLRHGIELISRFVNETCYAINIDEMLEQLLKYSWESKRKFDIIAAMIAAELGDEDLLGFSPKTINETKNTWKDFGWYYDSYGKKRYGIIPR